MACVDPQVWKQAQAACSARQAQVASVKGFGYALTGIAGLRGLGLGASGTWDILSSVKQASAPPASAPSILTNAIDPNDPCTIAAQTPCAVATAPPAVPGTPGAPTSTAGGFSHWGLLAALAVGGGALYLVMRKKS